MLSKKIYEGAHRWFVFGRDPDKPENIIDTNQYMICNENTAILLDPGGIELFAPMLASVVKEVPLENIKYLFASHQDPDIISSLGMWDQILIDATLYGPWIWESFIRHFGMHNTNYSPIDDAGGRVKIGDIELEFIPAHYLHASGNYHVYDPEAKILFSGDVGAALEPAGSDLFVKDFDSHISKMELFHQRWMPSNRAKDDWIARARELDYDLMVPQHGRIFKGEDCDKFLDWFSDLQVGIAVP